MSARGLLLVIATAAALFAAAGCGDDDSEAGGSSSGEVTIESGDLSKEEFVKEADAICLKTKEDFLDGFSGLVKASTGKESPKEQSEVVVNTLLLPGYEDMIDEISTLGVPSEAEAEALAFLVALDKDLDVVEEDPFKGLNQLSPFDKSAAAAKKAGLKGCEDSLI